VASKPTDSRPKQGAHCWTPHNEGHHRRTQGRAIFNPGFIGQLNFHLSAADDLLRHADDKPSVGLLLCRSKDKVVVEYALRNLKRPLGVAEWETTIVEKLPNDLQASLPTVEEIEAELDCLQDE
jgi:YhcG PDDEXK nuclease domain